MTVTGSMAIAVAECGAALNRATSPSSVALAQRAQDLVLAVDPLPDLDGPLVHQVGFTVRGLALAKHRPGPALNFRNSNFFDSAATIRSVARDGGRSRGYH